MKKKYFLCISFLFICLFLQKAEAQDGAVFNVVFNTPLEASQFALHNSKRIAMQRLTTLENNKVAFLSFRDFLPNISVSYSENDNISKNSSDSRSKSIQISANQTVFDGGKRKMQYDLGRINSQYAYQEFLLSTRTFESEIMQAYYQYILLKKIAEIKASVFDTATTQALILKREFELGITLEIDYLEYEVSRMQLEYERIKISRELEKAERDFKELIGLHEHAILLIQDNLDDDVRNYKMLEDHFNDIWSKAQMVSIDLKKRKVNMEFQQKMMRFDQMRNIPNISLQGSLNFSGDRFPLAEPSFSLKCNISFNNSLFPINVSNGYSINQNGLSGVTNSAEVQLLTSSTAFSEKRLADLSLLAGRFDLDVAENNLRKSIQDSIYAHDDLVHDLSLKTQIVDLLKRKLEINKLRMEKGEVKQLDYLNELIQLSQTHIDVISMCIQIESIERSFEILLSAPFGGIADAVY